MKVWGSPVGLGLCFHDRMVVGHGTVYYKRHIEGLVLGRFGNYFVLFSIIAITIVTIPL
ncbi:hypothetical protein BGX38DRAFT_779001 [Terfezia claveryi]|nr:hypothetical protein BGX38DRAFT_779001 [Terfezia claveryi]